MPVSRRSAGLRPFHLSLKSAAVIALATARPRIARAADRPAQRHSRTSPRAIAHPIEQQLQMELRMAFLARPSSSGPSASHSSSGITEARLRPGQHDHAFGHVRDAPQQRGDRRRGGGDPGRDREAVRRRALPPLGHRPQQAVAPLGKVDPPIGGEDRRPAIEDRAQPVERQLPVARQLGCIGGRFGQPRRRDFLDQQRIERPRQVGGKAHRLGRAGPVARDQPGERQQTRQRIDRRRDWIGCVGRVERAADPVLELGVADRHQARQHQPRAAGADEGFGDRPHGAIVGQQDAPARQIERAIAKLPPSVQRPGNRRRSGGRGW